MKRYKATVTLVLSGVFGAGVYAAEPPADAVPDAAHEAIPTLTVKAGRIVQLQGLSGAPISVLDRDEMDLRQARGLDDLLRDLPGVTVGQGPRRDGLTPVVRGLTDGRVVVRIDGARQNFQRNHRAQTYLDPNLLQRVEVVRGPASTLYGSGAIGGVVDFQTLEADVFLDPDQAFGARISTGYQSNADERVGALTVAGQRGDLGVLGSLSRSRADDYEDGNGRTEPFSGSDISSGIVKGHWDVAEGTRLTASHLVFRDSSGSHSTADRPFDPDRAVLRNVDRRSDQETSSLRLYHQPASSNLWNLQATVYRNDFDQDDRPLDPGGVAAESRLTTDGIDVFNTSRLQWGGFEQVLSVGVEAYRDDQRGFSAGLPDRGFSDAEQRTLGAFAQHQILVGAVDVALGLRADRIEQEEVSGQGRQTSTFDELSPQLALTYRLSEGLAVYGSYAEAFRTPNLRERFIGGPHFGTNQFLPNPDLEPEDARNLEAGFTFVHTGWQDGGDRLRGQLSLYQNTVDNFIEQIVRQPDFQGDPALANTTRFENVAEARLRGVEFNLRYDHPGYHVGVVVNRLRADDRTDNTPLEGIPADSMALDGAINLPVWEARVGARLLGVAKQDRLPPTTDPDAAGPTAGYALLDLYSSLQIGTTWRIDLRVDNVLDRGFRQAPNLIPGLGRNGRVQVAYRF